MEHKFYTDNFERLLKEQADEFRMYPSKRVWHSVYNDLHPDRKWPSIAVSLILVTVLFLIGYWNNYSGSATAGTKQPVNTSITGNNSIASISPKTTNTYNNTGEYGDGLAGRQTSSSNEPINSSENIHPAIAAKGGYSVSSKANPRSVALPAVSTTAGHKKSTASKAGISISKNERSDLVTANNTSNTFTPDQTIAADAAVALNKTDAIGVVPENNSSSGTAPAGNNPEINQDTESGFEVPVSLPDINIPLSPVNNLETPVIEKAALVASSNLTPSSAVKKVLAAGKQLSAEDKSWIDHYALYNKSAGKRWKGRLSSEIYIAPGAGFLKMTANTDYATANSAISPLSPAQANTTISYNPGVTFEAGAGLTYAITKNLRLRAGVQANFTNYSVDVTDINHPVLSTLMLNNLNTGNPYLESRASSLANIPGLNNKKAHNQTSQISLPLGIAVKLAGNEKIEWYAASSIQPTYVFSGKAYLVSSDHNNFIPDVSMIRKWNLNTAAETYIHYKMSGFTLQAGPEFRYQLKSTYSQKYTYNEKLYNFGLKIGIVKNL